MKFIADQNVGKLARWLRLLGYDTVIFEGKDDGDLIKAALSGERVLLTKDRQIIKRRTAVSGQLPVLLVEQDEPEDQLITVIKKLSMTEKELFSRCLECNSQLLPRQKEEIKERVPPYVFKTQESYMECPRCHRIYWKGTHWKAMQNKVGQLLGKIKND